VRGHAQGVRESRRSSTIFAIEQTALALFVERGFTDVTAEQIAAAAGISVRTFYRYFPEGKEGVVLLETRRGVDVFLQELRNRPPQELAFVAVREAAIASVRLVDDPTPPNTFGLTEASTVYRQICADQPALVARLIGERQLMLEPLVELVALRMSVDPETDVRPRLLVHAANTAITVGWLTTQANPALERLALLERSFEVLERGMAPAPDTADPARVPLRHAG